MIGTPGFNPSTNTLPITGSTLALTSTGVQLTFNYDGSHGGTMFCDVNGGIFINQLDASATTGSTDFQWQYQGVTKWRYQTTGMQLLEPFAFYACGNNTTNANRVMYAVYSQPGLSGTGIGCPAAQQVSIVTNDLDRVIFSNTAVTLGSGIILQLGNGPASETIIPDKTFTLKLADGNSYKVPCVAA